MKATIVKLFIQDKQEGLKELESLHVDINGVVGDKFYGKKADRSILLTSLESYEKVHKKGIDLKYGQLGENILLDTNPCNLPQGTRLEIEDVILEITMPCTMCKSLVHIDKSLPKILKNDRGIFAKIIKEGYFGINDLICKV